MQDILLLSKISFGVVGVACGIIFTTFIYELLLTFKSSMVNKILHLLWMFGIVCFFLGIYFSFEYPKYIKALAPIGVLLASFIASASVMKNIQENEFLNKQAMDKDKEIELSYLHVNLILLMTSIKVLEEDAKNDNIKNYSEKDKKAFIYDTDMYINNINHKELFYYLNELQRVMLLSLIMALRSLNSAVQENDNSRILELIQGDGLKNLGIKKLLNSLTEIITNEIPTVTLTKF